jgi:hypothetical protein
LKKCEGMETKKFMIRKFQYWKNLGDRYVSLAMSRRLFHAGKGREI